MSVSDLSGTRWLINTGTFNNSAFDSAIEFKINYALPNSTNIWKDNCDALKIGPTSITLKKQNTSNSRSDIIYDNERLWYIFDGQDVTNPELIAWFELNAVQQEFESEDYITNTYDLTQVANAIRKTAKNYTLMSYPSGMVDTLNNMGDFWTIEQLMSTDSLGDLYYDGSRTTIPDWAFTYKNINTAEFPNVLAIGSSAFYSDYLLSTISFPKVLSIGSAAFNRCYKLTTASFPSCISIGNNAFYNCSSLTTVSFPNCISIGGLAFYGCSSLTTVSFPNCTSIGLYAFQSCVRLMTVSFPSCISISSYAFSNCTSLTIAPFPKCTFIGSSAFYNCYSLTIASFPECGSIGNYAFNQCYNLISLNLTEVSSVPALDGSYTFLSTPIGGYSASAGQYGSIYVPASLYDAFTSATNWTYFSARMVSV